MTLLNVEDQIIPQQAGADMPVVPRGASGKAGIRAESAESL